MRVAPTWPIYRLDNFTLSIPAPCSGMICDIFDEPRRAQHDSVIGPGGMSSRSRFTPAPPIINEWSRMPYLCHHCQRCKWCETGAYNIGENWWMNMLKRASLHWLLSASACDIYSSWLLMRRKAFLPTTLKPLAVNRLCLFYCKYARHYHLPPTIDLAPLMGAY